MTLSRRQLEVPGRPPTVKVWHEAWCDGCGNMFEVGSRYRELVLARIDRRGWATTSYRSDWGAVDEDGYVVHAVIHEHWCPDCADDYRDEDEAA